MSVKSRAVSKREVIYEWHGTHIDSDDKNTEHKVATWFASRCANELMSMGLLRGKHFDKFKMLLAANVEEKLVDASRGDLRPGSDVIYLARAKDSPAPMFEFRWNFASSQLSGKERKVLIRHYEAEPVDRTGVIFGLLIHCKHIFGDEEEIQDGQNQFIDEAIEICQRCAGNGWVCE